MDIVIYDGSAFETWTPETLERDGAGGSEFMLADIASGLAALGHNVRVYVKCGAGGTFGGVPWRPMAEAESEREVDLLVAWRTPEIIASNYLIRAKAVVFVATDSHYGSRLTDKLPHIDRLVAMSEWHASHISAVDGVPLEKIEVIRTGVHRELFKQILADGVAERYPGRLIHTSAPTRSLRAAMLAMPRLREVLPGAELHVYHGFLTLKMFAENRGDRGLQQEIAALQAMIVEYHDHGVRYFGRQNRKQVYEALLRSNVWVYPTHVAETSCMAAQEAAVAGCRIVTVGLGALRETVGPAGVVMDVYDEDAYVRHIVRIVSDRTEKSTQHIPSINDMVWAYDRMMMSVTYDRLERYAPAGLREPDVLKSRNPAVNKAGVCLVLIVRNEAPIIEPTLDRVKHLVDGYYIIDTGSTDGTQEIIRGTMARAGLPGIVVDRPWVNFKHNRTELVREARDAGWKWLLTLDADCLVETALTKEQLLEKIEASGHDQLIVKARDAATQYTKLFVIRASKPWYYDLPTHEWIFCEGPMSWGNLDGVVVHETGQSHRRKSGRKAKEDVELLSDYLAKNPKSTHRPRALFYLAQSYRNLGQPEAALPLFWERAGMEQGTYEERYEAAMAAGELAAEVRGQPEEMVEKAYELAIALLPTRAEAFFRLGRYRRLKGKYQEAVTPLEKAAAMPLPAHSDLFLKLDVYEWLAKDELAVALSWIDDRAARARAAKLFRELIDSGKVPASDRKRIEEGEKMCLELVARHDANAAGAQAPVALPGQLLGAATGRNWVVVSPPSHRFSAARALDDVVQVLMQGLRDLGIKTYASPTCIHDAQNIIVGAHAELPGWDYTDGAARPPKGTIIYQTEVWSAPWWDNPVFREMLREFPVWEYSELNRIHYEELGLPLPTLVPLGPVKLSRWADSVQVPPMAPCDVLFIGSINGRRQQILDELRGRGLVVSSLTGRAGESDFGSRREAAIKKAKVVVNVHYYERAPYEQARLVPLLRDGVAVVSEVSELDDWIGNAILHKTSYEHLASECELLVKNTALRENAAEHARRTMEGHSMRENLLKAISGIGKPAVPARPAEMLSMEAPMNHLASSQLRGPVLGAAPVLASSLHVGSAPALAPLPPSGPVRLNLGCSDQKLEGYVNVDRVAPADQIADLSQAWPWADNSVDEIRAHDFIEHIADKNHTMNEAYRVLKPGGAFDIVVPTTDGRGAFQDPDHRSYWNANSFWYYEDGNPHRERFGDAYGITARFRTKLSGGGELDANQIAHLRIVLEAVKPKAVVAEPAPAPGRVEIDEQPQWDSDPETSGSWARPFLGMMRVKNEGRWIRRSLLSLLPLCQRVFVLDDGSTDNTVEQLEEFGEKVQVIRSPFRSFDEARDKQFLLEVIRSSGAKNSWVINLDGDEQLRARARVALRKASESDAMAMALPIHYLWDDALVEKDTQRRRVDGVYGTFTRVSVFRLDTDAKFRGSRWASGGLHCGNAPEDLKAGAVLVDAPVLHYGYMKRYDRVRKYRWYNSIDPNNHNEDCYRHMIAGDGPQREGEDDIVFPDAKAVTKHAGPLRLEPVE